ncbi:MAG: phage major capsid protein [Deltaproteobacteria bacterium]|nr:phage major capsid protein [Deltaproteobacteria bacterium]
MRKLFYFLILITGAVLLTVLVDGFAAAGFCLAAPVALAGVKQSTVFKQERSELAKELEGLIEAAEKEERDLNEDELKREGEIQTRFDELEELIARAEKNEKILRIAAGNPGADDLSDKDKRDLSKYSFLKAIRSQLPNQRLEGLELEMHQEGEKEMRDAGVSKDITGIIIPERILNLGQKRAYSATGGSSGSEGGVDIATDIGSIIDDLRARLVVARLGATYLTGLQGNVKFPKGVDGSVAWEGENDANADAGGSFGSLSMSPKRVGGYALVSKQLILQSSHDIENYVRNMLIKKVVEAIEDKSITGDGTNDTPTGIINTSGIGSVVGGDNGAAPDWADIINLEKEVAVDNADIGSLAYLTNPKVRAKLKTTALDSGSGLFVWGNDRSYPLNGYAAGVTTLVPSNLTKGTSSEVCSAIIFGNFADLLIGQWGGMEVLLDPYTKALNYQYQLIINVLADIGVRNAESFSAMLDALTT